MSVEGRLRIDLTRGVNGHAAVGIASSRPYQIVRTFAGRTPQDVVRTLPLLFSVCGMAQGSAAVEACERALRIEAPRQAQIVRALLVASETAREHLIRIAMDWRRFLSEAPQSHESVEIMQCAKAMREAIDPAGEALTLGGTPQPDPARIGDSISWLEEVLETLVFGEPAHSWLARQSYEDVAAWARAGGTLAQRLIDEVIARGWADAGAAETHYLPELDDAALGERLLAADSDNFIARPDWDGAPCETTPLARQAGHALVVSTEARFGSGLLTRLVARLVELAGLPQAMRADVAALGSEGGSVRANGAVTAAKEGWGIAQIEAARGRLVHAVEIADGIVTRYRILAPTEWNFHPQGAAARGLAVLGRPDAHQGSPLADLIINSIDPCVGYDLRIG